MFHRGPKISNYFRIMSYAYNKKRFLHYEQKIRVNGVDINVVKSGEGDRSVLLLPGALGSSWTDFKPQIEQLPKLLPEHTIFAWDPSGYGKSIPPKRQWGLDFFESDAFAAVNLMKALNRPKFTILGWSDGGITGLIAAGNFGENVEKLVIWGTGAYINADELKVLENIRDVKKWSPKMRQPMEEVYGAERFAELWSEWIDAVSLIYKERNGDFCIKQVKSLKTPCLILHGGKDPMIAQEHIPFLRQHIRGAKYYEFPDGKHNIHLRYSDEFNKKVSEFILGKM